MPDDLTQSILFAAFSSNGKKAILCDTSGEIVIVSEALLTYCDLEPEYLKGKRFCIGENNETLTTDWLNAVTGNQDEFFLSGLASLESDTLPFTELSQFTITPLRIKTETLGFAIVLESNSNFENAIPESVWLQFFRNTEDGLCLFDESLNILARNKAFQSLCGPASSHLKNLTDIFEVNGSFEYWLSHSDSLNDEAQIKTTNPSRQVHISVTSLELFDQHLYWCYARDISATAALRKRLDQTSLRLASLFENSIQGAVLTNLDGIHIDVNQQFSDMLGFPVKDILGKHYSHFNAPNSNEMSRSDALKFQDTGHARPFVKTLLTNTGEELDVEIQLIPHCDKGGRPLGTWNFIQPVAEKRANEIKSAYQYEKLFEQSMDAIVFSSASGEIKLANEAFQNLIKRSPEETIDRLQNEFTHPDDVETETSVYNKQLLERGYTDIYEKRLITPNSKELTVSVRSVLVTDEDGHIQGSWSIARDENLRRKLIESLAKSERRFRTLFSNSIDAIALWTASDELQYANKAYLELIGYTHQEFRSLTFRDITPSGWEEADQRLTQQVNERGYSDVIEKELRHSDGTRIPINIRASAVKDDDNVIGSWVIIRDIREQKSTLQKLEHSKNMLKQTSRMTRAGSWELNIQTGIYTFSDEVYQILSLPRSYKTDMRNVLKLFDEDAERHIYTMFNRFLEGKGTLEQDLRLSGFSPERWVRVNAEVTVNERAERFAYGAIQDISDFKSQQKTLESDRDTFQKMAFHDPLTKLPNRLLMEDRFDQTAKQARRLKTMIAIMIIDLDNFKTINDQYGHLAGDTLLSELASRLKSSTRASDTVARLGGDEFIVIATLDNEDQASNLAQKMLNSVNADFTWQRNELFVSCSIGIAVSKDYDASFEKLYACADGALYDIKKDGKAGFSLAKEE